MRRASAALALALAAGTVHAQVVIGLDDVAQIMRTYNTTLGTFEDFTPNGGAGIRALAADDANRTMYFSTGAQLWRVSYDAPRTPTLVAAFSGAVTTVSQGMAYVPSEGVLYATQGTGTTNRLYTVNPTTAVTTEVRAFGAGDFAGMDYDPATNKLYISNDSSSTTAGLTGTGIYTIDAPFATGTLVEIGPYPTGATADMDGLAVGGGNVYLARDLDNCTLYIYNLASATYTGPFTRPGGTTTSEVFSGATYAPGLGIVPPGANVGLALADSADCTVGVGGTASYTATVSNFGPDAGTNVTLTATIPANADTVASTPSGTLVGSTYTINLGTIAANGSAMATITMRPTSGTSLDVSVTVAADQPDGNTGNNSASQNTALAPVLPGTAAIKGVFSTVATSSSSDVPGMAPAKFATGIIPGRPYRSPNGNRWIQAWDTDIPTTTQDQVLIVHDGTNASVAVQEGVTVLPSGFGPEASFDAVYGINDAGQYVFSGLDNSNITASDAYVVKWDGTQFVTVAQEGGTAPAPTGGIAFGTTNGDASIANNGTVSFYATITGLTTTTDSFLFTNDGNTVIAQEGVTVPTGQVGGGTFTSKAFDAGSAQTGFFLNNDHSSYIYSGTTNDATAQDRVAVLNNDVRVQEATIVPGTTFTSPAATTTPFDALRMESDSSWFVRGHNADTQDWILLNGRVVAQTDAPITPGSSELYDDAGFADCFYMMAGNNRGEYVVGGTTSAAEALANAVLVLNGLTVIARENDPVDLDNDGVFDDDAFIRVFIDDRGFMTNNDLYMVVRLRNAAMAYCGTADADTGLALIRISLPARCVADMDDGSATGQRDGGVGIEDLLYYLTIFDAGAVAADVDDGSGTGTPDGGVGIEDLLYFLQRYDAGC